MCYIRYDLYVISNRGTMRDILFELQDLRRLSWSEKANTSGTGGCFLKSREETGAGTWYYKLSCYDSYRGVYGHECVNEVVASRLMSALGIPHLEYRLVHALVNIDGAETETWLNRSKSFRATGERKQALDTFYDLHKQEGESPLELCDRYGWGTQIRQMMLVDYLIANRDRHGANIEVLRGRNGSLRLAPIFDNGLSFVFSCYGDESRVSNFNALADVNANNYLGTKSLSENLERFVAGCIDMPKLTNSAIDAIFLGLERTLPETHLAKMKEMIIKRWQRYEAL